MAAAGDKIKAGKMLSKFLREIADEQTELVSDPNNGDRMGTKAEALARNIWKMALGYVEETTETVGDKEITRERVVRPDKAMIQLVWDRLEGKAESSMDGGKKNLTLVQRVDEAGVSAINHAGGVNAG